MKSYRFLQEADDEFFEHIAYYDGFSLSKGDAFVTAIETAVSHVRTYPEIGSRITKVVRKHVITGFPYSLLYINDPDEIIIVAIAPHKRRPGYWRTRLGQLRR